MAVSHHFSSFEVNDSDAGNWTMRTGDDHSMNAGLRAGQDTNLAEDLNTQPPGLPGSDDEPDVPPETGTVKDWTRSEQLEATSPLFSHGTNGSHLNPQHQLHFPSDGLCILNDSLTELDEMDVNPPHQQPGPPFHPFALHYQSMYRNGDVAYSENNAALVLTTPPQLDVNHGSRRAVWVQNERGPKGPCSMCVCDSVVGRTKSRGSNTLQTGMIPAIGDQVCRTCTPSFLSEPLVTPVGNQHEQPWSPLNLEHPQFYHAGFLNTWQQGPNRPSISQGGRSVGTSSLGVSSGSPNSNYPMSDSSLSDDPNKRPTSSSALRPYHESSPPMASGANNPAFDLRIHDDYGLPVSESFPASDFDASSPPGNDDGFHLPRKYAMSSTSLSPAPSASSSTTLEVLVCEIEGCGVEFTGCYRKGNLARHKRMKHGPPTLCLCEADGCSKKFKRADARLKHYRSHHSHLAPNAALPRRP